MEQVKPNGDNRVSVFDKRRKGAPKKEYQVFGWGEDLNKLNEHDKKYMDAMDMREAREIQRLSEDERPYWTEDWDDEDFSPRVDAKTKRDKEQASIEREVKARRKKIKQLVFECEGEMLDWREIAERIRLEEFSPTTLEKLRKA